MDTQKLAELSAGMEVTVGGMDSAVEPIGIYLRRVTEVAVLMFGYINRTERWDRHNSFGINSRR